MSALRCRHKCQIVFRLCFVSFLNNFLVVLRCRNWKKHEKWSSVMKLACRCHFGAPRTDFLPLGGFFGSPLSVQGLPRSFLGFPGSPPNGPKWGPRGFKQKVALAFFCVLAPRRPPRTHPGAIFYDFWWFSKVLLGKIPISKKKHHFYLHNSHFRCLLCR